MKILRWLAIGLGILALVPLAVAAVARFSDGPIGPFAGGALRGGTLVDARDVDWSFARGLDTLEFQLVEPPRSRTVWFALHDGHLYVPCGVPSFRLWKQWPHEAQADGRAILRVGGRRFERQAVRVADPAELAAVSAILQEKYALGEGSESVEVWIFRMDPRG